MHPHHGCARSSKSPSNHRPRYDLGEIFRAHGESFRARHALSPEQAKVMRAIEACRTAALGGHLDVCLDCGGERPAYNSCRNRHCPKCQAIDQHRWLEQRERRILPVPYFHVVFTLPGLLAPLGLRNRRLVYDLLFAAASQTLLTLGADPDRLGARLGITMVLHSWTRDLRFHPHVHAIVTGGGLSFDDESWIEANERYLFPVQVLGRLFRGKFLHLLAEARREERLEPPEELTHPDAFARLLDELYAKDWVVYVKRPFAGPEQVFSYLGRYTHRVGISNSRILDVTGDDVTLATRDGESVTLSAHELIRRFLLHVLPRRFVKIRHYGLMASSNVNGRLELARSILVSAGKAQIVDVAPAEQLPSLDVAALLLLLTGLDLGRCPSCGSRRLVRKAVPASVRGRGRSPPRSVRP